MRPVFEPVANAARIRLKRRRRSQPDAAVGLALGDNVRRGEQRPRILSPVSGGCGHGRARIAPAGVTAGSAADTANAGIGLPPLGDCSFRIIMQFFLPLFGD
jgi:hypothetical protein